MTVRQNAPDDIVECRGAIPADGRPPLIVVDAMVRFLDEAGLGSGPTTFQRIGEGASNETYLVSRQCGQFVLRRPPRPPWPPSAHNVVREARIISALTGVVRVPRVLAVCDDSSVIGAPFYITEYIDGVVLTTTMPHAFTGLAGRQVASQVVDALVELHSVSRKTLDCAQLPDGSRYLERQLQRFADLWAHNKTREIAELEQVGGWLEDNRPTSADATLVHGDFRLGNLMFARTATPSLLAILDWELATVGDPLADVGYLLATWVDRDDPPNRLVQLSPVTRGEGFSTRRELGALYESRSGRSVTSLSWYCALALWKSAIFMEGNYARAMRGDSDDPYLLEFDRGVLELTRRAAAYASIG